MNSKVLFIAGLFVALIISIGAGYFFVNQDNDYSPTDTARRSSQPTASEVTPTPKPSAEQSSTAQPSTAQSSTAQSSAAQSSAEQSSTAQSSTAQSSAAEQISLPPKQNGALNAQDLSLGVLTIDDPEEKVRRALGEPLSSKVEDYGTRLKYDALEVVLRNGKVSALVSQTSAVSTPRGIHDGSPAQQVFDEYGTNYEKSNFEDTTLYEYTITSKGGTPCWLRFAVRNTDNRVDYISVRFLQ